MFSKGGFIHYWRPAGSSLCLHSLSTHSQHGRARGTMDPAEWGSEKHPAFPVWEQAAVALPWPHKYFMHSQLRDITVSMQQGLPVLQRGSALLISVMSRSSWKLHWATKNCHLSSPKREELQLSGRYLIRFCTFSTEADMLKHQVNKSLIWYLNSL